MAQLSYREAVGAAIAQEMRRDDNVIFLGEDIAAAGGVFKTTEGLLTEFGPLRVVIRRSRNRQFLVPRWVPQ